jgi:hypothetical protein
MVGAQFIKYLAVVTFVASGLVACIADSAHEGNACSKNDDCGGNLTCQPIVGRKDSSYCCPTPANSSKEANCQPVTQ